MDTSGSHAREGIQGHYYLPFPVHYLCPLQVRRYAHMARKLKTPQGTVDVGLIRDEANKLAPRRGPSPELSPLPDDLADMVALERTATQASTDTTPVESISGSSTALSSSRTTPLPALVPLARVQKLEAQMLHFCIISSRGCRSRLLCQKSA